MRNFSPEAQALRDTVVSGGGHAFLLDVPQDGQAEALYVIRTAWLCLDNWPCGECLACRETPHPDWITIGGGPGARIRRLDVAGWPALALVPPFSGRAKVFVVQAAHRLSDAAANLLLKLVEEPPERVKVVLTSDRPVEVLPTLRSRCRPLHFGRPGAFERRDWSHLDPWLHGDWGGNAWPDALESMAEAIRQALAYPGSVAALSTLSPQALVDRWAAVVEATEALGQNANKDLVRRGLERRFRSA